MVLHGDAPLPGEYGFMPLDELRRRWPDDVAERVLVARRLREREPDRRPGGARACSTLDQRRPPPRQHALRAASTRSSRTHPRRARSCATSSASSASSSTPDIAEALYIALVTDTGRFQYTNTTPKALRLAAELVEAGADVHRVFQGVYESVQFAKLKLLARALERAQVFEGGRIVVSYLLRTDFAEVGAAEPYSEGIIDYLRAVEGADMAVLIREPPRRGRADQTGEPARERRRARRVRDRAQVGRRRSPAGGRVLERGVDRGDHGLRAARVSCLPARA